MPETDKIEVKAKDYISLLWVVLAAVLGFGLLCGATLLGIRDINTAAQAGTPPIGVVDFFVANINTVIAETVVAFSDSVSNSTSAADPTFTGISIPITGATSSSTPSITPSPTSTFFFPTRTSPPRTPTYTPSPTRTPTFTATSTSTPSNTPTFTPSFTPTYTPTKTPSSTPTDTPEPTFTPSATNTPVPSPTDTPVPTDTPIPTETSSLPAVP